MSIRVVWCIIGVTIVTCGTAWLKDRSYRENAAKREGYFMSLHVYMTEAKQGDTLENTLKVTGSRSFDDSFVRLYADPYDELGASVSDFLELKWVSDGENKSWEIHEIIPHKVSLFENDRLIISEKDGLRWQSGRSFVSERAKGSN